MIHVTQTPKQDSNVEKQHTLFRRPGHILRLRRVYFDFFSFEALRLGGYSVQTANQDYAGFILISLVWRHSVQEASVQTAGQEALMTTSRGSTIIKSSYFYRLDFYIRQHQGIQGSHTMFKTSLFFQFIFINSFKRSTRETMIDQLFSFQFPKNHGCLIFIQQAPASKLIRKKGCEHLKYTPKNLASTKCKHF